MGPGIPVRLRTQHQLAGLGPVLRAGLLHAVLCAQAAAAAKQPEGPWDDVSGPLGDVPGAVAGYFDAASQVTSNIASVPGKFADTLGEVAEHWTPEGQLTHAVRHVGGALRLHRMWPFRGDTGQAPRSQDRRSREHLRGLRVVGRTQLSVNVPAWADEALLRGGDAGWVDPVHEFQGTLVELKRAVLKTERDLEAALVNCHKTQKPQPEGMPPTPQARQACEQDRAISEVRGRMRRLQVAMKRVSSLKPVAFALQKEGTHVLEVYKNTTGELTAAKVKLGSTEMQKRAIEMKLQALKTVEASWRQDMHEVAKKVVIEKQHFEKAEKVTQVAEERRLTFLAQLHAVLEGVAVGDQAAEVTYEEAEATLRKAKDREAHAKKMIFQAQHLLDQAYGKAGERDRANKAARSAGAPNIITSTDDTFDNFGKGQTAGSPLPLHGEIPALPVDNAVAKKTKPQKVVEDEDERAAEAAEDEDEREAAKGQPAKEAPPEDEDEREAKGI